MSAQRFHLTALVAFCNVRCVTTTIGQRLEHARKLSRLSAAALGRLAGLSHATVSMIESGARQDPSSGVVGKIARVLGISADWLISEIGDPPEEHAVLASVRAAQEAAQASGTDEAPDSPPGGAAA